MVDFKADLPQSSKRPIVVALVLVFLVEAAIIAVVVFWAARRSSPPPHAVATSAPHGQSFLQDRPSLAQARDYFDGQTLILPAEAASHSESSTITIKKTNITDLEWTTAGNAGRLASWTHHYSFLYDHFGKHYVVDADIEVQKIGSSLALMGFQARKVVPAQRIRVGGEDVSAAAGK